MKPSVISGNNLLGADLNKPKLYYNGRLGLTVPAGLFKFVIVAVIFLLAIIGWLGWRWYDAGWQRDNSRLSEINQLIAALQKYQNQFAVFPAGKNWPELFTKLPDLPVLQDPLTPARFYFYCPTENGYLAGVDLERAPQAINQKNLAQGLALNGCLTSSGVTIKSLTCSGAGVQGELNGVKSWVWCLGNL